VLLAGAQSVEIDGQGRILIPPKMRDEAGLDRALVLQTVGERLEIWAADRWAARLAEAVEMVQGMDVQGFLRGAP
jgi:MraZ protein